MEIVNIEAGTFREMVMSIQLLKEKLENLKGRQTSKSLDDWMDNQEVCMALNISQRTLQAMRSNGTLSFSQIDRKTYYRRQDVIRLIEKGKKRQLLHNNNIPHLQTVYSPLLNNPQLF